MEKSPNTYFNSTWLVSIWIRVLNEYVHSNEIASRHLSLRGLLVFGMYNPVFQQR